MVRAAVRRRAWHAASLRLLSRRWRCCVEGAANLRRSTQEFRGSVGATTLATPRAAPVAASARVLPVLFVAACTLGGGAFGCVDRATNPVRLEDLPRFAVDVGASTVVVDGHHDLSEGEVWALRSAIAAELRTRLGVTAAGAPAVPARFVARLSATRQVWPLTFWVLCLHGALVGCPTGNSSVDATIELQVGDRVYRGAGEASAVGGLYYQQFAGTAWSAEHAVHHAISNLVLGEMTAR